MRLRCANTAERIEVLFGVKTPGDPKNIKHGFDAAFTKLLWPVVAYKMSVPNDSDSE